MSLKQFGGVFGRNPTFNDVTVEGDLILNGDTFTGLDYQGTWNASTNTPALTGGSGTTGEFYIVSVAGATDLDGITNWAIGDWAMFNGSAWQRIEGGANGNFVDLSASGNVTLSGGTANGVLYLDGSKVATSGSALTFDGTTLGVGTSGGGYRIAATAATNLAAFSDGSTQNLFLTVTGGSGSAGAFTFNANNGGALVWQNAGAEKMRLTTSSAVFNEDGNDYDFRVESDTSTHAFFVQGSDGYVGIGTSSPTYKLDIVSSDVASVRVTTPEFGLFTVTDGTRSTYIQNFSTVGAIGTSSNNPLVLTTNSTERLRIDSSGNVGIGVTPVAGYGTSLQVRNTASGAVSTFLQQSIGANSQRFELLNNALPPAGGYTGGYNYTYTGASATSYRQEAGAHSWYTAPSGTAGAAITFTERLSVGSTEMVVNDPGNDYDFRVESDTNTHALFVEGSSGNVLVNTTAATGKFTVAGTLSVLDSSSSGYQLAVSSTNGLSTISAYQSGNQALSFNTASSGSSAEAMRIDSSGNVGIGASSPATKLHVVGTGTFNNTAAGVSTALSLQNNTLGADNRAAIDFVSSSTKYVVLEGGYGASAPQFNLKVGNPPALVMSATTAELVVNDPGNDYDFRIESDTNTHAFFVDAGNSRVGINNSTPSEALEVSGNIKTTAPTGGTAAAWKLGTVATVSPTSPNRTIEVEINGTIYYLAAKTTND